MRIITHADMDAFFAAIEERDNPRYHGLPLVIGADPKNGEGRGVVSTANYEARKYGIHSAQPIALAWRLSQKFKAQGMPEVIFLEPDMEKFGKNSEKAMSIFKKYSKGFEQASVDEAYCDFSYTGSFAKAEKLAREMQREIKATMRLTCSVGIGPNKLIAKIASGIKKPEGLTVVMPSEVLNFLGKMAVGTIPGIGPKTEKILQGKNIFTIKDLRQLSRDSLSKEFGKTGMLMYDKARGIDDSPLEENREIKSIGEQETFQDDTRDFSVAYKSMSGICERVVDSLPAHGFSKFQSAALTVRFADFETKDRAVSFSQPINSAETLRTELTKILLKFFDKRENPRRKAIRLIGVRLKKFV